MIILKICSEVKVLYIYLTVFLDLPKPWFVVKFAKEALKVSKCDFFTRPEMSHNVESVENTCRFIQKFSMSIFWF